MRFLADENFNNRILRGLQAILPDLDIIRAQDTAIYKADDPSMLAWAARENRIVLTHDKETIPRFAYERVKKELPMPGVIEVIADTPIGQAIDELAMMIGAGSHQDFENQVNYIPI
jgi:hypothetical protein